MFGRALTDNYTTSPQISPEDVAGIAEAGFGTIICNRPDAEVPPGLQSADLRAAAEAAGVKFVDNPFSHAAFDLGLVDRQRAAMQAAGDAPVYAYCASGNRCSILWGMAMVQAGEMQPEEVVERAMTAGYDLRGLMPQLTSLASNAR